jgi:hypothetical protein
MAKKFSRGSTQIHADKTRGSFVRVHGRSLAAEPQIYRSGAARRFDRFMWGLYAAMIIAVVAAGAWTAAAIVSG